MKLLFSEHKPDYGNYIFPYAIWAVPEPGETLHGEADPGTLEADRVNALIHALGVRCEEARRSVRGVGPAGLVRGWHCRVPPGSRCSRPRA